MAVVARGGHVQQQRVQRGLGVRGNVAGLEAKLGQKVNAAVGLLGEAAA